MIADSQSSALGFCCRSTRTCSAYRVFLCRVWKCRPAASYLAAAVVKRLARGMGTAHSRRAAGCREVVVVRQRSVRGWPATIVGSIGLSALVGFTARPCPLLVPRRCTAGTRWEDATRESVEPPQRSYHPGLIFSVALKAISETRAKRVRDQRGAWHVLSACSTNNHSRQPHAYCGSAWLMRRRLRTVVPSS